MTAIWTDPKTWTPGSKLTAAELNQQIRDNESWLKENIELGPASELTIDTGAITITKSYHTIDTEDDEASDELDTIGGGSEGRILIIHSADNDRIVILKNATGNLILGEDIYLDDINIHVMLICDSAGNYHVLNISPGY
jgi:hypothetical protein